MDSDSVGIERRRLAFTIIENIVLEDQALGAVDLLVYMALAKHADTEGVCWPSMATIAKLARVHRATVAEALKRLEARGYLKRSARFRPDGGVASNVYQLMPTEAKRYPVAQDDTPCQPQLPPPVAQDDTNYTHFKLDLNEKRETQIQQPAVPTREPAVSLCPLIDKMKQEAQKRGAPPSFMGNSWTAAILELQHSGVKDSEILQAFIACIEIAPHRVSFFSLDFLEWRKVSSDRTKREHLLEKQKREQEAVQGEREAERQRVAAERKDPHAVAQIEAAVATLPWRRAKRGTR